MVTLTNAVLVGNALAATALETDPPGRQSASIEGVYTLTNPTTVPEVFRAYVGFCSGTNAAAQMEYQVTVGSQQPAPPETIAASSGQLASVQVPVPAGTTQITLTVIYGTGTQGDVVWVDPRIEAPDAPSPSPLPTVASSP